MATSFRGAYGQRADADAKGKGIMYEEDDDDAPIQLVDRDESYVIKEARFMLIGKILNPKKQDVEKLLQTMPSQWGLAERITANDLGNGNFLFNFESEDDIKHVLRQGPFHFNFCMFVLVRWEPIVHDDYPWIIPFWVNLIGFPLHLWTNTNLKSIGQRIGHIDTIELTEGRMLIDVDSRRPLKFSRKVEYKGDEVTIEIKYDMLFKHCTTCGMMTHEKGYCPTTDIRLRLQTQPVRSDVFSRVQNAQEQPRSQYASRDFKPYAPDNQQSLLLNKRDRLRQPATLDFPSVHNTRAGYNEYRQARYRQGEDNSHYEKHSDMIIRRKREYSRSDRYGDARAWKGPYDRNVAKVWKPKRREPDERDTILRDGKEVTSYEYTLGNRSREAENMEQQIEEAPVSSRKLASKVVTPSRKEVTARENITVRREAWRISQHKIQDCLKRLQVIKRWFVARRVALNVVFH
ncbi:Uncharacterized protein Rs2_02832 [Raphanus sativus]|nr:Uncharacterized protein Rs2_02832 [Raphanus sativus]